MLDITSYVMHDAIFGLFMTWKSLKVLTTKCVIVVQLTRACAEPTYPVVWLVTVGDKLTVSIWLDASVTKILKVFKHQQKGIVCIIVCIRIVYTEFVCNFTCRSQDLLLPLPWKRRYLITCSADMCLVCYRITMAYV